MPRPRHKPRAAAPRAATTGGWGAATDRLAAWADAHRAPVLRLTTVVGAAVTVLLTWPLWQARAAPPNLPLLPLPGVPLGPILLAALAVALWRPAAGLVAYGAALTYGLLADQARLQPQLLTFAFLIGATLPGRGGVTLARAHLLLLWFYAGLHKLLSVDFMAQSDSFMMRELVGMSSPLARAVFPWLVVATEIGAAALAALPRTRPLAAGMAVLLHLGILLMLGRAGYNLSVWPWNVVCAVAALILILPWRRTLREEWRAASRPLRVGLLAMAVYPLGFYAGLADTYTSWSLYAANAPRGLVCDLSTALPPPRPGLVDEYTYNHRDGTFRCRRIEFADALGAPLPPIHRLFRAYFRRTCADGEFLLIHERRRGFRDPESAEQAYFCADERAARFQFPSPRLCLKAPPINGLPLFPRQPLTASRERSERIEGAMGPDSPASECPLDTLAALATRGERCGDDVLEPFGTALDAQPGEETPTADVVADCRQRRASLALCSRQVCSL